MSRNRNQRRIKLFEDHGRDDSLQAIATEDFDLKGFVATLPVKRGDQLVIDRSSMPAQVKVTTPGGATNVSIHEITFLADEGKIEEAH